jgi:hypothetical protein
MLRNHRSEPLKVIFLKWKGSSSGFLAHHLQAAGYSNEINVGNYTPVLYLRIAAIPPNAIIS